MSRHIPSCNPASVLMATPYEEYYSGELHLHMGQVIAGPPIDVPRPRFRLKVDRQRIVPFGQRLMRPATDSVPLPNSAPNGNPSGARARIVPFPVRYTIILVLVVLRVA